MNDRPFEPLPLPDRGKDLWQTVAAIEPHAIAHHHLQSCQAQINGYWDEDDRFHDTIRFTHTLIPTILSSSLGITPDRSGDTPWLNFRYALTVSESENAIGELNLILNDSLEIIKDERKYPLS